MGCLEWRMAIRAVVHLINVDEIFYWGRMRIRVGPALLHSPSIHLMLLKKATRKLERTPSWKTGKYSRDLLFKDYNVCQNPTQPKRTWWFNNTWPGYNTCLPCVRIWTVGCPGLWALLNVTSRNPSQPRSSKLIQLFTTFDINNNIKLCPWWESKKDQDYQYTTEQVGLHCHPNPLFD